MAFLATCEYKKTWRDDLFIFILEIQVLSIMEDTGEWRTNKPMT